MSRVCIIIPARYNSQRLPGKPLADIVGQPMIIRVYRQAQAALPTAEIVAAVDDVRVLQVLQQNGALAAMTGKEHESGTDRCAEIARGQAYNDDDIIINVQGDEPLVPIHMIQEFARFCTDMLDFQMATIAVPVRSIAEIHDPNVVKVTRDIDGRAISFSRAPIPYARDVNVVDWPLESYLHHVGVYAYRNSTLQKLAASPPCDLERIEKLEQLRALWLGVPIDVMDWPEAPPKGVDTADDLQRVVAILTDIA